jgi:hypothetical protein
VGGFGLGLSDLHAVHLHHDEKAAPIMACSCDTSTGQLQPASRSKTLALPSNFRSILLIRLKDYGIQLLPAGHGQPEQVCTTGACLLPASACMHSWPGLVPIATCSIQVQALRTFLTTSLLAGCGSGETLLHGASALKPSGIK